MNTTLIGDLIFFKLGSLSTADGAGLDFIIIFPTFMGFCFGTFYAIGFFSGIAPKLVIFEKSIKPIIKSGDLLAQQIKRLQKFCMVLYLSVFLLAGLFMKQFSFAHFPAFLAVLFIFPGFLSSEVQRIGFPELPKILGNIIDGESSFRKFS